VKIEGNGGHLSGAVTEEDVRAFVGEFQVDQVRLSSFTYLKEMMTQLHFIPFVTFALLLLTGAS